MSLSMFATRAFLWLDTRGSRRALSRPDAASHVDPARRPAPVPRALERRHQVTHFNVRGSQVTHVQPRSTAPTAEVLYLHGGGYVSPIGTHHWWLIDKLVRATGARITVPDYPLAPEHTLDDALPLLRELYAAASDEVGDRRFVVAGDSAGGGLAVAVAIMAREEGRRPADRLLLFAPWLDVTLSDPDAERLEAKDPILRCIGARDDGRAWAGQRLLTDPLVSPLNDRLVGLPAMTIVQGGCDVLLPDTHTFTRTARAAGVAVDLLLEPGGFHVYPVAYWTPEAKRAYVVSTTAILGERTSAR
jgi:acetyl esterase/lipase